MSGGAHDREGGALEIVEVRLLHYCIPFLRPYVTAKGTATAREGIIVQIKTGSGLGGLGEASLLPDSDGNVTSFISEVEEATAWALGRTITSVSHMGVPRIWRQAGAGVEIATWDALARNRNLSLTAFLGTRPHPTELAINALVSNQDVEGVRFACEAAKAAGYPAVKLKVGVAANPIEEIARIAAARAALGPAVKLRLDANGAWTEDEALEMSRWAARHDIEYLEQPLQSGNLDAMRLLRLRAGIALAADEDACSEEAIERVIAAKAADVVILKPLLLGGVRPTLKAAALAREAGLTVTVTTTIDTGVGTAAAIHANAILSTPGFMPGRVNVGGLGTIGLLETSLIQEELPIERGAIGVPAGAGLGVQLDPEQLERYTVRDWTLAD